MFTTYHLILIPIFAAVLAQIIKVIIAAVEKKFTWRDFNSYGGMPSSHSALVTSLVAVVGYFEGWDSGALAISLVLALVVIRDAGGFRRVLGQHAEELNRLATEKFSSAELPTPPHFMERLGHTPAELFFGALIGLFSAIIYILIV